MSQRLYKFGKTDTGLQIRIFDFSTNPHKTATLTFKHDPALHTLASAVLHSEIYDYQYPHVVTDKFAHDVIAPNLPTRVHEETLLSAEAVKDWIDVFLKTWPTKDLVLL